jgi:hypothetical protein
LNSSFGLSGRAQKPDEKSDSIPLFEGLFSLAVEGELGIVYMIL